MKAVMACFGSPGTPMPLILLFEVSATSSLIGVFGRANERPFLPALDWIVVYAIALAFSDLSGLGGFFSNFSASFLPVFSDCNFGGRPGPLFFGDEVAVS